ncbi:helix-turn-helix domain-containing protein [Aquimarina algiphila]|uniref:Helix-turn-helix domain-containing protein n=1 Tax=Aquimarina algiphila TaxID=2047982 RepID=A0A554VA97_9FLAO|nr:helix-turn-helix domain-containing protein [Aquimarina algiphila]TSE02881.1 helix-turn-helix domain-containing protein [Aquimarina algiphila]
MELIVFEKDSYYKLMEETMVLMYKVIHEKHKQIQSATEEEHDFLTTEQALKLMGLKSKKRLYMLRDEKLIDYYQHGRRKLYSKKSIIAYLNGQKIV